MCVCVFIYNLQKKRKMRPCLIHVHSAAWGQAEKEKEGRTERNGEKEREAGERRREEGRRGVA